MLAFAVAAARRPGYDHVADTMSKLNAAGSHDWLLTAGMVAYVALVGLFALGLQRIFGTGRRARILWGGFLAHGALMLGVAIFRDDVRPGGFFTLEGALHDVLSGLAFSALVVAMLGAVAVAKRDPAMTALGAVTWVAGAAMTLVGIAFLFTPAEVQGIPQRVFVTLAICWITFLAVYCLRRVGPGPSGDRELT